MSEPKIPQKSPYVKQEKAGDYYWCACGASNNQPYCDGSHHGTSFHPISVKIDSDKQVAWCGCKHTKTHPFCDGTHKHI